MDNLKIECSNTVCSSCDVDYLEKSNIQVNTWWNGEGISITVFEKEQIQELDITWMQWEAVKKSVKAVLKFEDEQREIRQDAKRNQPTSYFAG